MLSFPKRRQIKAGVKAINLTTALFAAIVAALSLVVCAFEGALIAFALIKTDTATTGLIGATEPRTVLLRLCG